MSTVDPVVHSRLITLSDEPPSTVASCGSPRREVARVEWRLGDGGEPSVLVEAFLSAHGLPVGDLSAPYRRREHAAERICGAAVLVGAAAAAGMVGGATGHDTPAPDVPDLVAVVYEHGAAHTQRAAPALPWWVGEWRPSWTPGEHAAA